MNEVSDEVIELEERIAPLLAGRKPEVQSAVLADLLAKWVLGFQVANDLEATTEFQSQVMAGHIKLAMDLVACQGLAMHEQAQDVLRRN